MELSRINKITRFIRKSTGAKHRAFLYYYFNLVSMHVSQKIFDLLQLVLYIFFPNVFTDFWIFLRRVVSPSFGTNLYASDVPPPSLFLIHLCANAYLVEYRYSMPQLQLPTIYCKKPVQYLLKMRIEPAHRGFCTTRTKKLNYLYFYYLMKF